MILGKGECWGRGFPRQMETLAFILLHAQQIQVSQIFLLFAKCKGTKWSFLTTLEREECKGQFLGQKQNLCEKFIWKYWDLSTCQCQLITKLSSDKNIWDKCFCVNGFNSNIKKTSFFLPRGAPTVNNSSQSRPPTSSDGKTVFCSRPDVKSNKRPLLGRGGVFFNNLTPRQILVLPVNVQGLQQILLPNTSMRENPRPRNKL